MTNFQTTRTHAHTEQVDREMAEWWAGGERDGDVISDQSAVAIAGWLASPNAEDAPYTRLAQTGQGDTGELGAAIKRDLDKIEDEGIDTGAWWRDADFYLLGLDAWVAEQEV